MYVYHIYFESPEYACTLEYAWTKYIGEMFFHSTPFCNCSKAQWKKVKTQFLLTVKILCKGLWIKGSQFIGNQAKGRISKRASQENKAPNFPKNEHFLAPDTHTYVSLSGSWNCSFFGKFDVFCFLVTPAFEIRSFALLPTKYFLKTQSCKSCNKYILTSTQITNTEIFAFLTVLVCKLFSRKVLFINRRYNGNCLKVGYFLRK